MELLGFPGITADEDALIRSRLDLLSYLPIDMAVEDHAIQLRRSRQVKLPDADSCHRLVPWVATQTLDADCSL